MAMFGNQPKPVTLKDFGDQFNVSQSSLYLKPQTIEYEVNPYLLQILHTIRIFAGEDDSEERYAHLDYFYDMCETFN
jgi:predicted transcriptional regulator